MGKIYKSQNDIDDFDDVFDDELNDVMDVDDYLERQPLGSRRRRRYLRDRSSSPAYYDDSERYRLPRDWQDFDYTSNRDYHEDWD